MRTPIRLALPLILTLTLTSAGCGGTSTPPGDQYTYKDVTVAVTPNTTSLAVNATQQFTATVTNAPDNVTWATFHGTLDQKGAYIAPAVPPVCTQDEITTGCLQGYDNVRAIVFYLDPETLASGTALGYQQFIITAPSVTAGITPATATVPLGATQQFTPYAVGNLNLAYTLQVGGVTGGSTSLGTISSTGLYTAPTAMPMTGPTVTITVISQADPTKSATATITLQ
jgi:hypothetical protein